MKTSLWFYISADAYHILIFQETNTKYLYDTQIDTFIANVADYVCDSGYMHTYTLPRSSVSISKTVMEALYYRYLEILY